MGRVQASLLSLDALAVALLLGLFAMGCRYGLAPERSIGESAIAGRQIIPSSRDGAPLADRQLLMVRALTAMRSGNAVATRPAWQRALKEYPELREYHLYYLALANASAGDADSARRLLETLLRTEPESILVPAGALHLGRLLIDVDPKRAAARLHAAIAGLKKGSSGWAKASLLAARVDLQLGHGKRARQLVDAVRRRVGPGLIRRRAHRAAGRIRAVTSPGAAMPAARVAVEAELLLHEGEASEAARLLLATLAAKPSRRLRPRLLDALATVRYEQGRLEDAEDVLREIVRDYPSRRGAPQAMLKLARWRWNRDEDRLALGRFTQFVRRYPRHRRVAEALIAIGRIHQGLGRYADARAAYERVARRYRRSRFAPEARWRQGWLEYMQGHYATAADSFGRLATSARRPLRRERALYWQARATERASGVGTATPLFAKVILEFPYGFYAGWVEEWFAAQLPVERRGAVPSVGGDGEREDTGQERDSVARENGGPAREVFGPPRSLAVLANTPGASSLLSPRFERAVALATMGFPGLAERELDAIAFPPSSDEAAQLVLLEAYARVGSFHRALVAPALRPARRQRRTMNRLDYFLYPRGYWDLVRYHAGRQGVDPYLVLALMRRESAFDADAVSTKNAVGLMQLMPKTAARVAVEIRRQPPSGEDLYRPAVNIELGTTYLKDLLVRYHGAIYMALAAYNAGEAAVARWEQRLTGALPDEFVEQIGYPETREYVKAVMRNYRVYRSLYGETGAAPGF